MFAWKLMEYRCEKREREPDMELKLKKEDMDAELGSNAVSGSTSIGGSGNAALLESISYDGLCQLSPSVLVFKVTFFVILKNTT